MVESQDYIHIKGVGKLLNKCDFCENKAYLYRYANNNLYCEDCNNKYREQLIKKIESN